MSDKETPEGGGTEPGSGPSDPEHLTDSPNQARAPSDEDESPDPHTAHSRNTPAEPEHTAEDGGSAPSRSAGQASAPSGGLGRALRRFFWMDDRMAAATQDAFGPGRRGWDEFDLGSAAVRGADRLVDSGALTTAGILLYRSAAALFAHAHLMRAGHVPSERAVTGESRKAPDDSPDEPRRDAGAESDPARAAGVGQSLEDPGNAFDLGCQAVRAAERLRESGGPEHGALLLLRAAAVLFVEAYTSVPDGALRPPALGDQDWERLSRLPGAAEAITDLSSDERTLVTACLGPAGESHISTLPLKERQVAARVLGRLAQKLAAPLSRKASAPARVILGRWLRIGAGAALLAALVTYGVIASQTPSVPNFALDRPVTVSSTSPSGDGRDPKLLVDGDTSNLGFHTAHGVNQQVTIDLGAVKPIQRVVVFNRSDCCQERAVPLHLEVSKDGRAYQRVATRATSFARWQTELPSISARYVRLLRPKQDYFHLAEVEVY